MSRFVYWLIALAAVAVAVVICYVWFDWAIASWVHEHRATYRTRDYLEPFTHIPDPLIPLGAAAFLIVGLRSLAGFPPRRLYDVAVACGISVVMGEQIKNGFKWFFGRPWPETWRNNNSSYIGNQDYVFHWFKGGGEFSSFPSGHTAATVAVLSVLWICYPRFRALYVVIAFAVIVGLIGSNFHFLGDTIAGAFLGASVGWITVLMYDRAPAIPMLPRGRISSDV
jgi:membrane-associated phospholipid phosphatase